MRIFGLDAGIASVGWAVIDVDDRKGRIVACGTRMFDAPETDKDRRPTNAVRRQKRGMRRVIRRRRQRMTEMRALLQQAGLLDTSERDALALGHDPWRLRAEALDRRLAADEFAAVLGHIARHRGFRSNAKSDHGANAAAESSRMLSAIDATRDGLSQWRTVGEMFANDPDYEKRKRNRGGSFDRSILRDDQEAEIRMIFAVQRRLRNKAASEDLADRFIDIAFSQRPLADTEHLVGFCPFRPDQRRAARRSHAFELFRLHARLAAIRIVAGRDHPRPLTAQEIAAAAKDFGTQKKLTWKWLRKRLGLDQNTRFADVMPADEDLDFVARTGAAAEGTYAIREAVGPAGWKALLAKPATLDRVAAILTFQSDLGMIRDSLAALPIEPVLAATLADAAADGRFNAFTRVGHISAAAARAIVPYLARGLVYSDACAKAGFDHAARPQVVLQDVRNAVVRKSVGQILKQVKALVQEYGRPDRIHVELARDVGKGAEERDEIRSGIERRNKERDRLRNEFEELLGRAPSGPEEMLRFELWKEQAGRCLYTGKEMEVRWVVGTDNRLQVDHILPWSRFGDDSFINKTLCLADANARKKSRTPFEWLGADKTEKDWTLFESASRTASR